MTGELAVNLSVRCSGATRSSGDGTPRTGGGRTASRTTRTSPSRARRNFRRRQEFLSRKANVETVESRNVRQEVAILETVETESRDDMDQEDMVDDTDKPQETADDSSTETVEPGECIWRQNDTSISDTSSGIKTVLENEDDSKTVIVEIHGEFSVKPEIVFKSEECFNEIRNDFLDFYKVDITALNYLSSEPCNSRCRFGNSCSTVTSVKMTMKPGVTKFPDDEFTFGELVKSFRVAYPAFGSIL